MEPLNIFDRRYRADPYSLYKEYRESDPVHWGRPATPSFEGTWYLTRYDDVSAALKSPLFGKISSVRRQRQIPEEHRVIAELMGPWLLSIDPPEHTRIRGAFQKLFGCRVNHSLQARVQRIAAKLVAECARKGVVELITDFAVPLPILVISDVLGLPASDHAKIRSWTRVLARVADLKDSYRCYDDAAETASELSAYVLSHMASRRRSPRDDLITDLVRYADQEGRLSDMEMAGNIVLLMFAGHETTANLIGNGVYALLRNPDQLRRLRVEPDLVITAVEELIRYDAPLQAVIRYAQSEVRLGRKVLRSEDQVCLILGAANRDPSVFSSPDDLDIRRSPNRHLGFGLGAHLCLGARLARVEARLAFRLLLQTFNRMELLTDDPLWKDSIVVRGFQSLPLSLN